VALLTTAVWVPSKSVARGFGRPLMSDTTITITNGMIAPAT